MCWERKRKWMRRKLKGGRGKEKKEKASYTGRKTRQVDM